MALHTHVTDAQEQAFKENADDLAQLHPQVAEVRSRARSRLESVGLAGALNCLACIGCPGYTPGRGDVCAKCSHDLLSHNVK
ncbi:hypothetical protein ADK65_16160 [Streptomyces sp. NRRL B-1140]|uniref:hypothetical protein n=1 Tax=Streptomyces sp. NRRL B-1140 TaxID=1415549 RepID=UPI0006AFE9AA|nr:hypothetical protein [Streptomyces sp. NRRL B-1140]KOW00032.1 hypothetical protein ADK65_16160 [Streptomyces sp. NRRL B-1140]